MVTEIVLDLKKKIIYEILNAFQIIKFVKFKLIKFPKTVG